MGCCSSIPTSASLHDEIRDIQRSTTNDPLEKSMHGIALSNRRLSYPGQYSPRPWHNIEKMSA
jgi:hypothetical protein